MEFSLKRSSRLPGSPLSSLLLVGGAVGLLSYLASRKRVSASRAFVEENRRRTQRIRDLIDPLLLNPGAVSVMVRGDDVTIKGPVLEDEALQVRTALRSLGHSHVHDRLDVHESAESVPGLQGRSPGLPEIPFAPEELDRFQER